MDFLPRFGFWGRDEEVGGDREILSVRFRAVADAGRRAPPAWRSRQPPAERRAKRACPTSRRSIQVDWQALKGVAKPKILELASRQFITNAESVIVAGTIGTGKTMLAIALSVEAARRRFRVLFVRAADLARSLLEPRAPARDRVMAGDRVCPRSIPGNRSASALLANRPGKSQVEAETAATLQATVNPDVGRIDDGAQGDVGQRRLYPFGQLRENAAPGVQGRKRQVRNRSVRCGR